MTLNLGLNDACFASEIQTKVSITRKRIAVRQDQCKRYSLVQDIQTLLRLTQQEGLLNRWHSNLLLWISDKHESLASKTQCACLR